MCYILRTMMKPASLIIAGAVCLALAAADRGGAGQEGRAFQLVYHSDTRGYYRPCG
jgi:hypothetical protein